MPWEEKRTDGRGEERKQWGSGNWSRRLLYYRYDCRNRNSRDHTFLATRVWHKYMLQARRRCRRLSSGSLKLQKCFSPASTCLTCWHLQAVYKYCNLNHHHRHHHNHHPHHHIILIIMSIMSAFVLLCETNFSLFLLLLLPLLLLRSFNRCHPSTS